MSEAGPGRGRDRSGPAGAPRAAFHPACGGRTQRAIRNDVPGGPAPRALQFRGSVPRCGPSDRAIHTESDGRAKNALDIDIAFAGYN